MSSPACCACALAVARDDADGSMPITWQPSRANSSARIPPPQPTSSTFFSRGHFSSKFDVQNSSELAAPLIGRLHEYRRLIQAYRASEYGQAQAVVLQGEAGIGKTHLAAEFLAWAGVQGADVLQGRAFEAGGRLPYQPLVEVLRSCIEHENAPDDLLS